MKTKTKEVYYCEHCKKHGLVKYMMIYHEKICNKNPENNRACIYCYYLEKRSTVVLVEGYFEPYEKEVEVLYCTKKDIYLYPPRVEIKGNAFELDNNHPMPKECELADYHAKIFDL